VHAQIAEIATDFTGSNVVFWTRYQLQTETDVTNQQKIYRWHNGEWSRLTVYQGGCCGSALSGSVRSPFVAGDGSVYGWVERPEIAGPSMVRQPSGKEVVTGVTIPAGFPGEVFYISSNGRYVAGGTYDIQFRWKAELLDTQTGERTPWKNRTLPAIADDGTLTYVTSSRDGNFLRIVAPNKRRQQFPLNTGTIAGQLSISPNGQWVSAQFNDRVRIFSASTGDVAELKPGFINGPGPVWRISNTRVLYLSSDFKQVLSFDPATQKTTVVSESSVPFIDLALSGDGNVAWTVLQNNQMLRLDLIKGTTAEFLPPLPSGNSSATQPDLPIGEVVRGSAMLLKGKYTKDQTVAADGQPWPISSIDDDGLWFQIPWEYRGPKTTVTVRTARNPFESVFPLGQASDYTPFFITHQDGLSVIAVAAHQDFNGVATSARPAAPGEIVHFYLTGLGPLVRDVPTGTPGPADGVRPVRPLTCYGTLPDNPSRFPITVINTVYAPSLIGFYQVDLMVPANAPDGFIVVHCGDSTIDRVGWLPVHR
jgi:uncharacterized protein (TIGR03437 family)